MNEKLTRAERLVLNLQANMNRIRLSDSEPRVVKISDEQTPDQKEKLKKALEKLRTFKDLVG